MGKRRRRKHWLEEKESKRLQEDKSRIIEKVFEMVTKRLIKSDPHSRRDFQARISFLPFLPYSPNKLHFYAQPKLIENCTHNNWRKFDPVLLSIYLFVLPTRDNSLIVFNANPLLYINYRSMQRQSQWKTFYCRSATDLPEIFLVLRTVVLIVWRSPTSSPRQLRPVMSAGAKYT